MINTNDKSIENKQMLKEKGLKITQARLAILDVFQSAKEPLSIKEIAQKMGGEDVDQATLYRNIESLKDLGLVNQVRFEDREMFYELSTSKHHHHLVCEKCGKVCDIENCEVMEIPKTVIKNSGFGKINRHSLEFFGFCNKCLKAV